MNHSNQPSAHPVSEEETEKMIEELSEAISSYRARPPAILEDTQSRTAQLALRASQYFPHIVSRLSQKEEECRRYRKVLEKIIDANMAPSFASQNEIEEVTEYAKSIAEEALSQSKP